jgi:hypothetical protein
MIQLVLEQYSKCNNQKKTKKGLSQFQVPFSGELRTNYCVTYMEVMLQEGDFQFQETINFSNVHLFICLRVQIKKMANNRDESTFTDRDRIHFTTTLL